jgi:hypothetical protein
MVDDLPVLRLSHEQFRELPEYSLTDPTGKFLGKMWRSDTSCGRWVIFRYAEHADPEKLTIEIYRPFLTVTDSEFVIASLETYKRDTDERLSGRKAG